MLDGGAAGVEDVDELVAGEAGDFFLDGAFLPEVSGGFVFIEECLDGVHFILGFEAGEAVIGGALDEADGALAEGGAVRGDAVADEVAIEREVRLGIAILGEHLEFLLGGALDFLEGDFECFRGGEGLGGLGLRLVLGEAGRGGARVRLPDDGLVGVQVFGGDVLLVHEDGIVTGCGEDGFGLLDVFELRDIEIGASDIEMGISDKGNLGSDIEFFPSDIGGGRCGLAGRGVVDEVGFVGLAGVCPGRGRRLDKRSVRGDEGLTFHGN